MSLLPRVTTRFKRDYKKAVKQGKDLAKLDSVMEYLVEEKTLPANLSDHALSGDYKGYRECHVSPDWLLMYNIEKDEIWFVRTGSHSELFG